MKKVIVMSFFFSLVYGSDINILNQEKKELREVEKEIIKESHNSSRNDWISSIDLSSSVSRGHSFEEESDTLNKSVSIGFSQDIYSSGGIEFSIQRADEQYASDYLSWESENQQLLQTIYEIVLDIRKTKLQLEQREYSLKNSDIELRLKKIQYEAGDVDIIELNDALMSKNENINSFISLENSLNEKYIELSKYTELKYEDIEIIDFSKINKEQYLKKNLDIMYQDSLAKLQNTSYKIQKSNYGVNLSLSTSASYSDNESLTNDTSSTNKNGSISLNLSVPLYDYTKSSTLQESKLEVLKQKIVISELKDELSKDFDETMVRIDTFLKTNEKIKENISLYEDMIKINQVSSEAGMSSIYDLEVLENTKLINQYDIKLNLIDIQLEYASLYFKIKGNI